jgi:KTSC domain
MRFVDSSAVEQIGYDAESMEIHVIFKRGGRRGIYSEVPKKIWDGFENSSSKGTYLAQVLKANGYPFRYDQ